MEGEDKNGAWIEENGMRGNIASFNDSHLFTSLQLNYESTEEVSQGLGSFLFEKEKQIIHVQAFYFRQQAQSLLKVPSETIDASGLLKYPSPDAIIKFIFRVAKDLLTKDPKNPD